MSISKTDTCAFCHEKAPEKALKEIAGFRICAYCMGSDLQSQAETLGFEMSARSGHYHSPSAGGEWYTQVDLELPLRGLEIEARMRKQNGPNERLSKTLKKTDPKIGISEFDDHVFVEVREDFETTLRAFLQQPGAREAVRQLVDQNCDISWTGRSLTVGAHTTDRLNCPMLEPVMRLTVALGIHIDRFANVAAAPRV